MKNYVKTLICLLVMALCLGLTACGAEKIDMEPYLSVRYSGYNGNGRAHVDFDFSAFEYGIMSQWKGNDQFEKLGELTEVELTIAYTADITEGLSNGDTITARITLDEELAKEYGYTFTGLEKKFTVEGLTEPVMIDPFDESIIHVSVDGISPFADVTLDYVGSRTAPEAYITYTVDNQYDLANGDTFTITATMSEKYTQQGYLLTRNELTVTVEGLKSYITDVSALSAGDVAAIQDKAEACFASEDRITLAVNGRESTFDKEDVGAITGFAFADNGFAVVQDGWGTTAAVIVPFTVDVEEVRFYWWGNEHYSDPLVKSFDNLWGYVVISDLILDETGKLIQEGSFHIDMSCLYENRQQMVDAIGERYGNEGLREGGFAK